MTIQEKEMALRNVLSELGSVVVAFSSGVDSTYLLKVAHETLGDRVLAVTAKSCSFPEREFLEAVDFCKELGVRHIVVETDELQIEGFVKNPPNRCYICKKELFQKFVDLAAAEGMNAVVEGSNMDDEGDYRPGHIAIAELDIKSPLRMVGLYKQEIRELSKKWNLPTWSKPSFACLSSRFPYGEEITREKLQMVEKAEELLLHLNFEQFRVRIHGNMARIEVLPKDIERIMKKETRELISQSFKEYGFTYVSVDMDGYRMGSMNETLADKDKHQSN